MNIEKRIWMLPAVILMARGALAAVPISSVITVDDVSVTVPDGTWRVGDQDVTISSGSRFLIAGAGVHHVENEPLVLSKDAPGGFCKGTKLKGPQPIGPVNARWSLVEDSVVIRRERESLPLVVGKDYLVSAQYALVGIGTAPTVTPQDVVFASYDYRVQRLDSVVLNGDGIVEYIQGVPGVASVVSPEISPDSIRLFNMFRPYGENFFKKDHLFFFEKNSSDISTGTTIGKIPETLKKLTRGESVTIVCFGDSVTVGADIVNPAESYVEQFRVALYEKFSPDQIDLHNVSLGGSRSIQWLYKGNYHGLPRRPSDICDFQRVINLKPDLVTIEFVNDMTLKPEEWNESYNTIYDQLSEIGSEVILITPHFVHPGLMGLTGNPMRPVETRPVVGFLREFAEEKNCGLADVSARWEQSWEEGVPYITMLANHFNHPDTNGARLFAQELMKCFSAALQ